MVGRRGRGGGASEWGAGSGCEETVAAGRESALKGGVGSSSCVAKKTDGFIKPNFSFSFFSLP